jgi:cytochrome o ubiquinol oxidase subunit 2
MDGTIIASSAKYFARKTAVPKANSPGIRINRTNIASILRITFAIIALAALSGCGWTQSAVLDPKGVVGMEERDLLFKAAGLMLIVIVPVFVLTFWFAWHFRASNTEARYAPHWSYSLGIDAVVWLVPAMIVVVIGYLVWINTHKLDPYKPIEAKGAPLEVDVVSQDWKWLFIYPEQTIAVVNELVFPSDRPLGLKLTSDTVMNSFYVPGLGGQIYTMAGMQTQLNLLADGPAKLVGRNTQYSGTGFPEQHFPVDATTEADFAAWVARVKHSTKTLDAATYAALAKPSGNVPVTYYSAYEPGLFEKIIQKYMDQ